MKAIPWHERRIDHIQVLVTPRMREQIDKMLDGRSISTWFMELAQRELEKQQEQQKEKLTVAR